MMELCISSIGGALDPNNFSGVIKFAIEHKFKLLLDKCIKLIETELCLLLGSVDYHYQSC